MLMFVLAAAAAECCQWCHVLFSYDFIVIFTVLVVYLSERESWFKTMNNQMSVRSAVFTRATLC